MSEINVVAIFYPKAGKDEELFALIKEQTEQVHAKEPNALIYYAFKVQDKDEIIFVEKYKDQATVDAHVKAAYFQEFAAKASALSEKPFELKVGAYIAGFDARSKI